jgi:hypothetical protein
MRGPTYVQRGRNDQNEDRWIHPGSNQEPVHVCSDQTINRDEICWLEVRGLKSGSRLVKIHFAVRGWATDDPSVDPPPTSVTLQCV